MSSADLHKCFVKLRTSEPQHCGYATLHHRQQLAAYMSLVRPTDTHCHTDTVLTVVLNTPPQISIWNPYTWWTSVDWRWFKIEGLDLSNTDTRADPVNYRDPPKPTVDITWLQENIKCITQSLLHGHGMGSGGRVVECRTINRADCGAIPPLETMVKPHISWGKALPSLLRSQEIRAARHSTGPSGIWLSKLVGRTSWWSLRLHIVVDWLCHHATSTRFCVELFWESCTDW